MLTLFKRNPLTVDKARRNRKNVCPISSSPGWNNVVWTAGNTFSLHRCSWWHDVKLLLDCGSALGDTVFHRKTDEGKFGFRVPKEMVIGEGYGTPLQYSCLENPMDRGAWWAAVHGVARVGHNWPTSLSLFPFMHWRRKWQPTPVFLPGESQGWGSLVGCRLWGCVESDTTEAT